MSKWFRFIGFLFCFALSLQASERVELAAPCSTNPYDREVEVPMHVDARGCLNLSGRKLDSLPRDIWSVQGFDKVKTIDLSKNDLVDESLDASWFPGTVERIILSHNRLSTFPADFISRLPKSVKFLDLSNNIIDDIGDDIVLAQRGIKIKIDGNRLSAENVRTIKARVTQSSKGPSIRERCVERLTSPCGRITKILSGAALFAGYTFLKSACDFNAQSPVARALKIAQNGLFVAGALHSLYNTYYAQHKFIEENPELGLGAAGLFVAVTPGIMSDTKTLALGAQTPVTNIESTYANVVYSGMRALGTVYAAGECISWLKNKWARSFKADLDRRKNAVL